MPTISSWKINNQIASLRDGTKGQANGAVPLNAQGKIDKAFFKAYADTIAMAENDHRTIAEYASALKVGMLALPLDYKDAEDVVDTDKKSCVEGSNYYLISASGLYGFNINTKKIDKLYTYSFSSIDKAIWLRLNYNDTIYAITAQQGFCWIHYTNNNWVVSELTDTLAVKFDLDTINCVGRAVTRSGTLKLNNDIPNTPTTWSVDPSWSSSLAAYNVFFCNNVWFVCGSSTSYGDILYRYNGSSWTADTDLTGRNWNAMLWVPYKSAYLIWSNTELYIKTSEQLHWWLFDGLDSEAIIYAVACSDDHIVVATSKGLFYSDLSDCVAIPEHRPVLTLASWTGPYTCYTVAYKAGLWFASGKGRILYSFNAVDWYEKSVDSTLLFPSALWLGIDRWLLLPEPNPTYPAGSLRCKAKLSNIQLLSDKIYM